MGAGGQRHALTTLLPGKRKEERGKRKEERGKRKEERGKRKEERGKRKEPCNLKFQIPKHHKRKVE